MKISFLLLSSLIFFLSTSAQNNLGFHFNQQVLKRGVYKTYEEFYNNTPSITDSFSVTLLIKKEDSSSVAAFYHFTDNQKKEETVWGFCDGSNVFVRYKFFELVSFAKTPFWKLESIGPYSYFMYADKRAAIIGPGLFKVITAVATITSPARYNFMVIDTKGKVKYPDVRRIKKFLAVEPALLKSYEEETEQYEAYDYGNTPEPETDEIYAAKTAIMKDYLTKLNKVLLAK